MSKWPLFLDSGAHSLYTKEVMKKIPLRMRKQTDPYAFYETDAFWDYVNEYATFITQNKNLIPFYANVDVIFNPKLSWKVLKFLESEYGLSPVPVIHFGTDLKWLQRHLEAGYEYIGIGGLGQEAQKANYISWADRVFNMICSGTDRMPSVRTHGFAIGSPYLMKRYPWWSVDSATWVKSAGFGKIYIPGKKDGKWDFLHHFTMFTSNKHPGLKKKGQHVTNIAGTERELVKEWLAEIGISLGDITDGDDVKTAINHRTPRVRANLYFYSGLAKALVWPRPFKVKKMRTRFPI